MLASAKGDVASAPRQEISQLVHIQKSRHLQVSACLSWYFNPVDHAHRMVQRRPVLLVPTLDRPPASRDAPLRGAYEFHGIGGEREEIVTPLVAHFAAAIGDRARDMKMRPDLARMDRFVEDGRANVNRGSVEILAWGRASEIPLREGRGRVQWDTEARAGRLLDGRRRALLVKMGLRHRGCQLGESWSTDMFHLVFLALLIFLVLFILLHLPVLLVRRIRVGAGAGIGI